MKVNICQYIDDNPRDGGAWWAALYGVAQSQTRLKRLSSSSSIVQKETRILISKEIPGLISFRMDWLDLLVVQDIYSFNFMVISYNKSHYKTFPPKAQMDGGQDD